MKTLAAATIALAAAGVLTAAPAQAAATTPGTIYLANVSNCGTTSGSNALYQGAGSTGGTASTVTGNVGDTITIVNECATSSIWVNNYPQGPLPGSGAVQIAASSQLSFTLTNADPGARLGILSSGDQYPQLLTEAMVMAPSNNNGGGTFRRPSGPRPAAAPALEQLSLSVGTSGATCTSAAVSGYVGSWVTLPGQADCSLPTRSAAKLLGWATTASFPVDVAQQQVSNGWGAVELKDADGRITAVFIPAGHSAYVSGANSLFPIFSA